jgi:signal transduction histidine kinase
MFKRISYQIALQFTAFVLLFLLANGAIFLAADLINAKRQSHFRLERIAENVVRNPGKMPLLSPDLPPMRSPREVPGPMRERVRILSETGQVLFGGALFGDVPFGGREGYEEATIQNEQYLILTRLIAGEGGGNEGFVQVAEVERMQVGDLPERILLYLVVSVAVSALTFVAGLSFARRSLKPAEESMQRLEQFTQDASHELRTPLAALSSSLDLALKTGKHHEGIVSAKEDLKEVSVLVERLLELARLDKFVLANDPVDLGTVVRDSVAKLQPVADVKGVRLIPDVTQVVSVKGDELLLRQALSNLLTNAVKFTPRGGTVSVRLTRDALAVSDTGIGIAAQDLPHIFDRFYQAETSRSNEGFGLGLALVKRITELHDWTIGVASEEGKGTTFTISFRQHRGGRTPS